MKKLKLNGLKTTIVGAAVAICGTVDPLLFYVGLVIMAVSFFIGDKVESGGKKEE